MPSRPIAVLPNAATSPRAKNFGISYQAIGMTVAVAEAMMIVVGSAFGPMIYGWVAGIGHLGTHMALDAGILSSLLYAAIARATGLYRLPTLIEPARHLARIAKGCFSVLLAITAVLFLLKIGSDVSRGAFIGFAAVTLLFCVLTRLGAADIIVALMARDSVLGRPAVLVGETDELASLSSSFLLRQFGLRETGRIEFDSTTFDDPSVCVRRIDEAMALARGSSAKEFVVAAKFDRLDVMTMIEETFRASPLPVRLIPNHVVRSVLSRRASVEDTSLRLIDLQRAPLSMVERAAKRLVDILGALVALVILAPIIVAAACAVKLGSSGPVIFRQRRKGFDQREFVIFKFRTMTVQDDGATIHQAKPGDNRVTRVGRILRRSSIDELPQLLNVLKGDMSLVGPRPHALAHDDQYKEIIGNYSMRHHVKPGITGWAQVNGLRGETAKPEQMRRRVDLDLWYVGNWSLSLDLRIMGRTCVEVVKQDAY